MKFSSESHQICYMDSLYYNDYTNQNVGIYKVIYNIIFFMFLVFVSWLFLLRKI